MKATQAGTLVSSMRVGSALAAQSAGIVTTESAELARHTANVHQLFAHRLPSSAPAPAPDGDEIIGLVAQVYGMTTTQAADRLSALDFAAARAGAA